MPTPGKPTVLFVVNPNAGKRDTRKLLRQLALIRSQADVRISEYAGHCLEIVRQEIDHYQVFVAVGGDGTVNEAATALAGSGKVLAVFPTGSGNGFAREFGFRKNLSALLSTIRNGKLVAADILLLNEKVCVNMSGVGFDSAVAHHFADLVHRGFWNYVISTLKTFWSFRPFEAAIQYGETKTEGRFFMITAANTRQFGNQALIAPSANPSDGVFELVLVSPFPWRLFPLFVFRLFTGTLKPSNYMRVISLPNGAVLTTTETEFHIDGEPVRLASPVNLSIRPGCLLVADTGKKKFRKRPEAVGGTEPAA